MEEHAYIIDSCARESNDGSCSAAVATMGAGVVFGAGDVIASFTLSISTGTERGRSEEGAKERRKGKRKKI